MEEQRFPEADRKLDVPFEAQKLVLPLAEIPIKVEAALPHAHHYGRIRPDHILESGKARPVVFKLLGIVRMDSYGRIELGRRGGSAVFFRKLHGFQRFFKASPLFSPRFSAPPAVLVQALLNAKKASYLLTVITMLWTPFSRELLKIWLKSFLKDFDVRFAPTSTNGPSL